MSGKKSGKKNSYTKNTTAKRSNEKGTSGEGANDKASNKILPVIAAVVVVAAVAAVAVTRLGGSTDGESLSVSGTSTSDAQATAEVQTTSGEIVIDLSEVGETATYYDYDADGTTIEVLAVTATDGSVRLALNTCQVCQGSPYAYFVQEGDSFICQNCRNSFSRDDIGLEAGGCNPVPVTEDNYEETDGLITISTDFLEEYKDSFTNWKQA
ncbi:MAG: DUF2318 domain-containing protein [Lachnospiraceae bacterium]|nr:DUF2318 domain-containing protein [Lachnospiraceae bacterium]